MNKVTVFITFAIAFTFTVNLYAQNHYIDSLENVLNNYISEDSVRINLLNDISWELHSKNQEKSLNYAQNAYNLSKKLNYLRGQAESLNGIGIYYYLKGNYPKSLEYFHNAAKIHEESGNKFGVAACLNNMGAIHQITGNYEESLNNFLESLKIKQEIGDEKGIPSSLNNIGNAYIELGKYNLAKEYYEKSLELKIKLGDQNGISASYENIGLLYKDQENYSEALKYLNKSLQIDQELGNNYDICLTYFEISNVYFELKDYDSALSYAFKSLSIAQKLDLMDMQKEIRFILSDIYAQTNNYKKAYENYVLYKSLNDSIFNEENIKKITALTYQHKFDKEKQAIELEQKKIDAVKAEEKKKLTLVRNFFIAGFIFMVIVAILILNILNIKKRSNKILTQQKQKIEDSITYAQTIQNAILPNQQEISQHFENFILFRPKDIVSGDFYWYTHIENYHFIAVVDCTGHGVPGAIMSVIGSRLLTAIITEQKIYSPKSILTELDQRIKKILEKKQDIKDGMEASLCRIEKNKLSITFSGAKNDLIYYHSRSNSIDLLHGDRIQIGGKNRTNAKKEFTETVLTFEPGDTLYLYSDGIIDQSNSDKQRFGSKRFQELLNNCAPLSITDQKVSIEKTLDDWQKNTKQRDDITVLGLKL